MVANGGSMQGVMVGSCCTVVVCRCRGLSQLGDGLLGVWFAPPVPRGIGVVAGANPGRRAGNHVDVPPLAKVGVAAPCAGDHFKTQDGGLGDPAPEAFAAMQREEDIAASHQRQ